MAPRRKPWATNRGPAPKHRRPTEPLNTLPLEEGQLPGTIGSKRRFMTAMRRVRGLQSYAAQLLGVTRQAVHAYIEANDLRDEVREIFEAGLDKSEAKLFEKVDEGNIHAIMFHLKTRGKDRGYVETRRLEGSPDNPIVHSHQIANQTPLPPDLELRLLDDDEVRELRKLAGMSPVEITNEQMTRLRELVTKARPITLEIVDAEVVKVIPGPEKKNDEEGAP